MKFTVRAAVWLLLFAMLLSFSACAGNTQKPVAQIGTEEILYEELRFQVLTYLDKHKDATEEELRAAVTHKLLETYALIALCAEHIPSTTLGSDAMETLVDTELAKAIAAFGDEKTFEDYLEEVYLTEHLMRRQLALTQMQVELENKLFKDTLLESKDTLMAWLDQGNYVRVRRVFIPLAMGEEAANAARIALAEGTTPEQLFTAEQKQAGATYSPAEYFYRGLTDSAEEQAALSLTSIGQACAPVASEQGYTLFLRVEDNRQTVVDYQVGSLLEKLREASLAPMVTEKAATLTLVWNEYGKGLVLTELQ